jgi:hypothetical protein
MINLSASVKHYFRDAWHYRCKSISAHFAIRNEWWRAWYRSILLQGMSNRGSFARICY